VIENKDLVGMAVNKLLSIIRLGHSKHIIWHSDWQIGFARFRRSAWFWVAESCIISGSFR
jgi:hypothetical protein